jgi:hypothetical protein
MESLMVSTIEPEDGPEVIWLMLSILVATPARQLQLLGELPNKIVFDERTSAWEPKSLAHNGATYLIRTLHSYSNGWIEEFEPCPINQAFFEHLRTMRNYYYLESFLYDEQWKRLRELAKLALNEVSLDPWPLPDTIDFHEYIEIY